MSRASATILVAVIAFAVPPRAQERPQRTVISLPGHAAPLLLDTIGVWREIDAAPARAFAALELAYVGLGIPVNLKDSRLRYQGNLHFTKMRTLGKTVLSRYVECGNDMTGARADKYRVHIAVVSRVDSLSPVRSRVRSAIVAGAEDVMGQSKDPIPCGSTGVLESRITDFVMQSTKAR